MPTRLTLSSVAHGGDAVGRIDGKAVFVAGGLPGEVVDVEIRVDKKRFSRADLVAVSEPSAQRVTPECRHFDACGGCQWQFAAYDAQLEWKQAIVVGQLEHLGGLAGVEVRPTLPAGTPYRYRNRMDFRVSSGKPALYRRKSHDLVPLSECHLLDPDLYSLFSSLGDLSGVKRITLRRGSSSGDLLAVVRGTPPAHSGDWPASVVAVSGGHMEVLRGRDHIVHHLDDAELRVTGDGFFQNNTEGARLLVECVGSALDVGPTDVLIDGYAGVGLFAATLGRSAASVVAVESASLAHHDLEHNLGRALSNRCETVRAPFEATSADGTCLVVDPPRSGLGAQGVAAVARIAPERLAYVSCDPAALARDGRLLRETGFDLSWVQPIDMFPQTFHIETVSAWIRS